jgi:hypothetical protein
MRERRAPGVQDGGEADAGAPYGSGRDGFSRRWTPFLVEMSLSAIFVDNTIAPASPVDRPWLTRARAVSFPWRSSLLRASPDPLAAGRAEDAIG